MIEPKSQWAVEIDVTNACPRKCSNCTRLVAHAKEPFFMSAEQFRQAAEALVDFPTNPAPDLYMLRRKRPARTRAIGIMGGEPLIHPEFPKLVEILAEVIPNRDHRGVLTGIPLAGHKYEKLIRKSFRFVNENTHEQVVMHQPNLVAIKDIAPRAIEVLEGQETEHDWMWRHIDACWLQELWSSAITPKGFFFCEVAAALDMVMKGPGGLPVEPQCWTHDIDHYREQAERWCPMCSVCLPLPPRRDKDEVDDVSKSTLKALEVVGSPRIQRGQYSFSYNMLGIYDESKYIKHWQPEWYMR